MHSKGLCGKNLYLFCTCPSLSKPVKMCFCSKYTVAFMVEVSGLRGEVGVVLAYGLELGCTKGTE